jgi:hypothetical protein
MKERRNLYFDSDLSRRLDDMAAKPGTSKSAIIEDAFRAYLDHHGAEELIDRLAPRLDRLTTHLNRIERSQRVLIESVALYIRFHFSILPPLADADQAAGRALAQERYQAFIEQVGRKLATQRGMTEEILERAAAKETKQ